MAIDRTKTILGRVKQIKVDGTAYPVTGDGATITCTYEYQYRPIVGSAAPRISILRQYYRVDCMLPEFTLANLRLAWNMPNAIVSGANFDTLYLGLVSTVTVRSLEVTGYVYTDPKQRRYIFRKACFFEPKPIQLNSASVTYIPVSFYCYADETQTTGQEFGYIESDT